MHLSFEKAHKRRESKIGEILGGIGAAAVAKAHQRFLNDLATDPQLKKELRGLQRNMSRVKD